MTAVIPIVFYHVRENWNVGQDTICMFIHLPREVVRQLLRLEYLLFDLFKLEDLDFQRNLSRNRILLTALDIMRAVVRGEVRANSERLLRELADLIITHKRDFKEEIEMFLKMSILYIMLLRCSEENFSKSKLLV